MKVLIIPTIREIYKNQFEYCVDLRLVDFIKKIFKKPSIEIYDSAIKNNYDFIEIPEEEDYAANCILVNENVIVPSGYPISKEKISNAGFNVLEVDVSEFKKLDGGLSCLSLRY